MLKNNILASRKDANGNLLPVPPITYFKNTDGKEVKHIVCFDLETQGTDCNKDNYIEVGLTRWSKNSSGVFMPDVSFDFIIKPIDGRMPEDIIIDRCDANGNNLTIASLTGITTEMIEKEGITEDECLEKILPYLYPPLYGDNSGDTVVTGYNVGFDFRFMTKSIERKIPGFRWDANKVNVVDVMTIYKDNFGYDGDLSHDGNKLGQRLDAAVVNLGVPVVNTHRACDDAEATIEALAILKEVVGSKISPYLNVFGFNPKFPLERITLMDNVEYYPQGFHPAKEVLRASVQAWYAKQGK